MTGKDTHSPLDDELEARAVELLRAAGRAGHGPESPDMRRFASQSPRHQQAIQRARRLVELTALLEIRPRTPSQERWFRIKLAWARFTGNPPAVALTCLILIAVPLSVWQLGVPTSEMQGGDDRATVQLAFQEQHHTAWRQQSEIVLPDGSTIWLGWNTRLSVTYDERSRHVVLDSGVAAFDVVSDQSRPFDVRSGDVITRVTGTQFVVNRQQSSRVDVSVLEGEVVVDATSDQTTTLGASDTVSVERGALGETQRRTSAEIGAWRDGLLVFENRPVLEVLAALEPYSRYRVDTSAVYGDAGRVTGTFFIDRADDALVSVLQSNRLQIDHQAGNKLYISRGLPERP
ncbi:MAG: FecR domain-containing protein [Pseudomonadota bacterium]